MTKLMEDEKFLVVGLAALFHAGTLGRDGAHDVTRAFGRAEEFLAEAKKRGLLPKGRP